jgi:DNA polymerase-3 subunit epsilon
MIRQVVLDTETTGLDPDQGDRVVEIGCLELLNHMPTESSYHTFINPGRTMSPGATEISGITDEMLADKPVFANVAKGFLDFIADSELIIHNAPFDLKFLNSELARLGDVRLLDERVFCTLTYARKKFPGAPASLDALCKRFDIDLSSRTKHGALIDARLLADVYLELIGGRQPGLLLANEEGSRGSAASAGGSVVRKARPTPLAPRLSAQEAAAHEALVEELGEDSLWRKLASS